MHVCVAVIDCEDRRPKGSDAPLYGRVQLFNLEVEAGATAREAVQLAGINPETVQSWGVCARKAAPETELHEGDRVDIGTSLLIDPMAARRLRAQYKAARPIPRPRHGGIHQLIKPLE